MTKDLYTSRRAGYPWKGQNTATSWDERTPLPMKAGTFVCEVHSRSHSFLHHPFLKLGDEARNQSNKLRSTGRARFFYYNKMQSIEGTSNNDKRDSPGKGRQGIVTGRSETKIHQQSPLGSQPGTKEGKHYRARRALHRGV